MELSPSRTGPESTFPETKLEIPESRTPGSFILGWASWKSRVVDSWNPYTRTGRAEIPGVAGSWKCYVWTEWEVEAPGILDGPPGIPDNGSWVQGVPGVLMAPMGQAAMSDGWRKVRRPFEQAVEEWKKCRTSHFGPPGVSRAASGGRSSSEGDRM